MQNDKNKWQSKIQYILPLMNNLMQSIMRQKFNIANFSYFDMVLIE